MRKNAAELLASADKETSLKDLAVAKMLRCRVSHFTDGTVIGIRKFVNEAFTAAREMRGETKGWCEKDERKCKCCGWDGVEHQGNAEGYLLR